MKKIDEIELKGKEVLIRLDLNVSSRNPEEIAEEDRLKAALPTITYVREKGGKAILMSHLGRPKGKVVQNDSLRCVAKALETKLGTSVRFIDDCIGEMPRSAISEMQPGDIVLLENLRFYPGEENNDPEFVKELAKLGEVYINDAFGTAHRAHASTYGLPLLFHQEGKPVAAGFLMQREIELWSRVLQSRGPKYLCLGGKKLKEKIKALEKLSREFDKVYIGGPVYNVVRAAQNRSVGKSLIKEKNDDTDYVAKTREFLGALSNLVLPDELVTARPEREVKDGKETTIYTEPRTIKEDDEMPEGYMIVDCIYGEEKLEELTKANVVVGFGPFGIFEDERFAKGTRKIGQALNNVNTVVLGGGDSAKAYAGTKAELSTGGGASITYLSKKRLDAIDALEGIKR